MMTHNRGCVTQALGARKPARTEASGAYALVVGRDRTGGRGDLWPLIQISQPSRLDVWIRCVGGIERDQPRCIRILDVANVLQAQRVNEEANIRQVSPSNPLNQLICTYSTLFMRDIVDTARLVVKGEGPCSLQVTIGCTPDETRLPLLTPCRGHAEG
jgi:hypothetical protein